MSIRLHSTTLAGFLTCAAPALAAGGDNNAGEDQAKEGGRAT